MRIPKKNFKFLRMFLLVQKQLQRLLILLHETQGCLYRSEILSFGHINLQRKPLFGNRKYI